MPERPAPDSPLVDLSISATAVLGHVDTDTETTNSTDQNGARP